MGSVSTRRIEASPLVNWRHETDSIVDRDWNIS